uniref:Uncharacterized protein n=1 Tax=Romanomermis culicivorax TaxID=13658 RepID=A0A915JU25_ROMCU
MLRHMRRAAGQLNSFTSSVSESAPGTTIEPGVAADDDDEATAERPRCAADLPHCGEPPVIGDQEWDRK